MSAALNADGTRILTVREVVFNTMGGATQLWDAATAATRRPLGPEGSFLESGRYPAVFSPDGRRYVMFHDATTRWSRRSREVLTTRNPSDRHGGTSHLTTEQIDDLGAHVLSL
jgi:hypothetical protein